MKLAACMSRSNVTSNALVVPLSSTLLVLTVPVVATTCVLRSCGPGTINGNVFWLNGGTRIESGFGPKTVGTDGAGRERHRHHPVSSR